MVREREIKGDAQETSGLTISLGDPQLQGFFDKYVDGLKLPTDARITQLLVDRKPIDVERQRLRTELNTVDEKMGVIDRKIGMIERRVTNEVLQPLREMYQAIVEKYNQNGSITPMELSVAEIIALRIGGNLPDQEYLERDIRTIQERASRLKRIQTLIRGNLGIPILSRQKLDDASASEGWVAGRVKSQRFGFYKAPNSSKDVYYRGSILEPYKDPFVQAHFDHDGIHLFYSARPSLEIDASTLGRETLLPGEQTLNTSTIECIIGKKTIRDFVKRSIEENNHPIYITGIYVVLTKTNILPSLNWRKILGDERFKRWGIQI